MSNARVLGVEGGGTKTVWTLAEADERSLRILAEGELPPTNFRLTSRERLREIFRELPREPERAGIFLAGCGEEDRAELAKLCAQIWPQAMIVTGSDRESGFAAAFGDDDGIAVNAGTGATITGRRAGRIEHAGGWGHILGDAGGGYFLALQALRFVLRDYDLQRRSGRLSQEILRALCLNNLDDLVRWAQGAGKMEIATLAPVVFGAAENGHEEANAILRRGARVLAEYTEAVARRLAFAAPPIALLGGLFLGHPIYERIFRQELAALLPGADVSLTTKSPSLGAAWLAMEGRAGGPGSAPVPGAGECVSRSRTFAGPIPKKSALRRDASTSTRDARATQASDHLLHLAVSDTELINERSRNLEQLSPHELAELFVREEAFVQEALLDAVDELARGIEIIAEALRNGGRLFYIGAGTSGRLGVLDATEIPPTFGASPELVQGIIAGGATALHRSVEGAEDNASAGAVAIVERGVKTGDVVCGISASGRAPFVIGALQRAHELGAKTLFITSNPATGVLSGKIDLRIELATGPELLAGSTRLKAGTATKVALNILSTGAMVQLGHVRDNLMIDVAATNEKLRDRAIRLVMQLANCDQEAAVARLAANGWNVRAALQARGEK